MSESTIQRIVYFSSPTCQPCKTTKPIIEKLTKDLEIDLELVNVSTDEGANYAMYYGVSSIPTIVIVSDGKTPRTNYTGAPAIIRFANSLSQMGA